MYMYLKFIIVKDNHFIQQLIGISNCITLICRKRKFEYLHNVQTINYNEKFKFLRFEHNKPKGDNYPFQYLLILILQIE